MTAPPEKRPHRAVADRQSPPATIDDLTGKFEGVSIRNTETPIARRSPPSVTPPGSSSPASDLIIRRGQHTRQHPPAPRSSSSSSKAPLEEEESGDGDKANGGPSLSTEQREMTRFKLVGRKKDFELFERVRGRTINVLQGLELHTNVFNAEEQKRIVDCVYDFQEKGRRGELRERTYSEPRKWMRGKGRVTIQFGCCYNYGVDKNGNPPGIIRDEEVDPIPPPLKMMVKRMVAWRVLPPTCIPNSCIINIYDKDDCIPPHIDHHDFVRPFCTVSFLSECKILFGTELKILGPGEFAGSVAIPLPLGSVLILNGNGADIAKHCVPAVPARRISITFRKMDDSKLPYKFRPDPELQNLVSFDYQPSSSHQVLTPAAASPIQQQGVQHTPPSHVQEVQLPRNWNFKGQKNLFEVTKEKSGVPFQLGQHDFPPLGSSSSSGRVNKSRPIRQ